RFAARYTPLRGVLPGAAFNLIPVLAELGVDYQLDDDIGTILREYVIELGPLARRWFERDVEVEVRDARLMVKLEGGAPPDFLERRQQLLRDRVSLEQRLRNLHSTFVGRLQERLAPEFGQLLLRRH